MNYILTYFAVGFSSVHVLYLYFLFMKTLLIHAFFLQPKYGKRVSGLVLFLLRVKLPLGLSGCITSRVLTNQT
jgi:hypothetical protein